MAARTLNLSSGVGQSLSQIDLLAQLMNQETNRERSFLQQLVGQGVQRFDQRQAEKKAKRAQSREDKQQRLGAGLALGGAALGGLGGFALAPALEISGGSATP